MYKRCRPCIVSRSPFVCFALRRLPVVSGSREARSRFLRIHVFGFRPITLFLNKQSDFKADSFVLSLEHSVEGDSQSNDSVWPLVSQSRKGKGAGTFVRVCPARTSLEVPWAEYRFEPTFHHSQVDDQGRNRVPREMGLEDSPAAVRLKWSGPPRGGRSLFTLSTFD